MNVIINDDFICKWMHQQRNRRQWINFIYQMQNVSFQRDFDSRMGLWKSEFNKTPWESQDNKQMTVWMVRSDAIQMIISFLCHFIDCEKHEVDKQWYESTIISQKDCVCQKNIYQINTFALNRIGEVIGTFIFGQFGDR